MSLKNGKHRCRHPRMSGHCKTKNDVAQPESRWSTADLIGNTDKFPSSAAFDAINAALNASEADRKDAIKQGNAVFAFTLKNAAGETDSWHIDLKEKGAVLKGLPEKANVTLTLSDADFASLITGKANAQRLFMSGKLKIKGDVMKATKLDPILKKAQTKAKL
ncbi:hypothetical protein VTJ49DRAFT_4801 [Mycothermus thermophilus]|uniref:SCP2 domain-containing protein n=1 Tax=Humicola insolens TaxID=85995 RepID=A0ABR3V4J0_HUMIN